MSLTRERDGPVFDYTVANQALQDLKNTFKIHDDREKIFKKKRT